MSKTDAVSRAMAGDKPPVSIDGDAQLAGDVNWLLLNLRWDIAADLERLIWGWNACFGEDKDARYQAALESFIRTYADRCHHGKEEDILFADLSSLGSPAIRIELDGPRQIIDIADSGVLLAVIADRAFKGNRVLAGVHHRTYGLSGQGHLQVTHSAAAMFFISGLQPERVSAFMENWDVAVDLVDAITVKCKPASGPRHDVPEVLFSRNPLQAVGSVISRSVWPVGAVSKMT